MSSKRQRASSIAERTSKSKSGVKSEEEKLEPESKKSKKDVTPSTRENGGQLGGLPLYGEQLPELGYEAIPPAAKMTCEKLHHVMERVKELKSHPKTTSDVSIVVNNYESQERHQFNVHHKAIEDYYFSSYIVGRKKYYS